VREIKFRTWHNYFETMALDAHLLDTFNERLNDERCVVMQFIGLKDWKGKEIYEGDICMVKPKRGPLEVVWEEDGAYFRMKYIGEERRGLSWDANPGMKVEIIGNIYEHPELTQV